MKRRQPCHSATSRALTDWLDKTTGELVAREHVAKERVSNAPVAVGDTVVVLTDGGKMAAYRATPPVSAATPAVPVTEPSAPTPAAVVPEVPAAVPEAPAVPEVPTTLPATSPPTP